MNATALPWPADFDRPLFARLRNERNLSWGQPAHFAERTESTNDLALADIPTAAPSGAVYVAHEQTNGRGRMGNAWLVPAGQSLAFSVLLRLPASEPSQQGLSLAVGLALRDVVAARLAKVGEPSGGGSPQVSIKWPNDVFVNGRKVAGILIESRTDPSGGLGLVIGIGLNAAVSAFPSDIPGAGSLHEFGATDLDRESLLIDCLGGIEQRVAQFLEQGVAPIVQELKRYDYLAGRQILVDGVPGQGAGINEKGELLVRDAEGTIRAVPSAHIELFDPKLAD